jgi:outer membrane protein TolC
MTNYLHKNLPPGPAKKEKDANGKSVGVSLIEQEQSPKEKIKELHKKKLALLTELYQSTLKQYQAGAASFILPIDANKLILQTRLELCETKQERIKVLEEMVKADEEMVAMVEKRVAVGLGLQTELQRARTSLLDAQIALEKAKLEK